MHKLISSASVILATALLSGCWPWHKEVAPSPRAGRSNDHPPAAALNPLDGKVADIAEHSICATTNWKRRGDAPIGYIKGVALVYAKSVCEIVRHSDTASKVMGQPVGGDDRDALAWYGLGGTDELTRLRVAYTMTIGLGMRESSGNTTDGVDTHKHETPTPSNAEAGLFQASHDSLRASPWLGRLYEQYTKTPQHCRLDVFTEGTEDLHTSIIGNGPEGDFQRFTKACPAFATEYAVVMLRVRRDHFGTVNNRDVQYIPSCESMLKTVEMTVAAECPEG